MKYHMWRKDEEFVKDFTVSYPFFENKVLVEKYGLSMNNVIYRAQELSLTKDKDFLAALRSEVGRKNILATHTPEAIQKMSASRRGQKHTPEQIAKRNATKILRGSTPRGSAHYNWKGGTPAYYRYRDPVYIAWRTSVLVRDEYTCQGCSRKCAKYERGLAAHHIKPYALYPALRLDVDNGLTLCRECHYKIHGKRWKKSSEQVQCACGCGTYRPKYDRYGRLRVFIKGHSTGGRFKAKA